MCKSTQKSHSTDTTISWYCAQTIIHLHTVCYGYCSLQLDGRLLRLHHTVSSCLQVCVLLHTECIQHYMHLQVASSQRICCQSMIFPSHLGCHASRIVATPTVYWHRFPSLTLAISTRSSLVALSKDQCGEQGIHTWSHCSAVKLSLVSGLSSL